MTAPLVSIVVPTLNEGSNLIDTVDVVLRNSEALNPEIIVVDDGSTDGTAAALETRFNGRITRIDGPGLGVAQARNAGAKVAAGEIIVFLDGHCYVPPGWLGALVAPFRHRDTALVGPAFGSIRDSRSVACGVTWRDAGLGNVWLPAGARDPCVPFHIGACQAVRADVFAEVGGFDAGMTRWGSEDIELCLRLWLLGYDVRAARDSRVVHLFRTARPYDVDVADIIHNHVRLALLHFDERRIEQVIARVFALQGAERALMRALTGGIAAERTALDRRRKRDLGWLFHRFGIGF